MESTRRREKTVALGTQENQAYVARSQNNMQRGRSVEAQNISLHPFSQMMVASNTYQRTTTDSTVTIEHSKQTSIRQRELNSENRYSIGTHQAIIKIVSEIENEDFHGKSPLSPCLFVTSKLQTLVKRFTSKRNTYYPSIVSEIGPYYSKYLDTALKHLESKFAAGCSWEYGKELNTFAGYFEFHPKNSPDIEDHTQTLVKLYKKAIETEYDYIDYIINNLVLKNATFYFKFLENTFSTYSIASRYNFITKEAIDEYKNFRQLRESIILNSSKPTTDSQVTEQLAYLDNKQSSGCPINNNDRRMYYNLLNNKIDIILKKCKPRNNMNGHDRTYILKCLANLCCKYSNIIDELPFLTKNILIVAQSIAFDTMMIINRKEENVDLCKEECLDYISILYEKGCLTEECKQLHLRCSQQQTVTKNDSAQNDQYKLRIDEIYDITRGSSTNRFLESASMLKKLLDEIRDKLMTMTIRESMIRSIEKLSGLLYKPLFKEIFHHYNKCTRDGMNDYDITQRLSMHYKEFIAHDPYTFILKSENYRHDWGRIGCLILYNKVSSLLNKKEIYEEDTKVLLLMKRLCIKLPNKLVRTCVKNVLIKCSQSMINNVSLISIKTANELSEWADQLNKIHDDINPDFHSPNNQWKSANPTQTPQCPPLAQSTSTNQPSMPPIPMMPRFAAPHPAQAFCKPPPTPQHPLFQPTMTHAKYRPENPFNSGIQKTVTRSFEQPMRLSQLQSVESSTTQIPTQNRWHQSHPEFPLNFPPPFPSPFPPPFPPPSQHALSQQASFMPTAGYSIQAAMPHQNIPMYKTQFKIDDPALDKILQLLLNASNLYQTQKDMPGDTLLTDPSSDYSSLLENGMSLLTNWIIQLEGLTIPRDEIYRSLMDITKEDGHQIVFDLFGKFIKHIDDKKTVSDVYYLRNCLFSIRTAMGMRK